MRKQIEKVLEVMRADYRQWSYRGWNTDNHRDPLYVEYKDSLEVTEGTRYYKIISNRSGQRTVQGFVVKAGHKKFKEGDLLKAASWAAPATNFARGNIFDSDTLTTDNIRWTGIK